MVHGDLKENSADMLFFYLTFGFEIRVQTRKVFKEGCGRNLSKGTFRNKPKFRTLKSIRSSRTFKVMEKVAS